MSRWGTHNLLSSMGRNDLKERREILVHTHNSLAAMCNIGRARAREGKRDTYLLFGAKMGIIPGRRPH